MSSCCQHKRARNAALTLLAVVPSSGPATAQQQFAPDAFCDYYSAEAPAEIFTFSADSDTATTIDHIASLATIARTFDVKAANVATVAAATHGDRRVLLYDQYAFAAKKERRAEPQLLSMLAHGMAHHFFRHSLTHAPEERRSQELEADRLSGTVLQFLGVSRSLSTKHLREAPNRGQHRLYPKLATRIQTVEAGWDTAAAVNKLGYSSQEDLPRFDLPPPSPSTSADVPIGQFGLPHGARLAHLADRLMKSAVAGGYTTLHYWAVRDGFAVATSIEQITDQGFPHPSHRWSLKLAPPNVFSLSSYLNALFSAPKGLYRLIAFVVSPHPFASTSGLLKFQPAIDWLWTGLSGLPPSLGSTDLTDAYRCTALIYEFEQVDIYSEAVFKRQSALDGQEHLKKARLWQEIRQ